MNRIKLKGCKRIRSVHPLPGDRLLVVAGENAFFVTALVWVDAAGGRELRREVFSTAESVAVSADGTRLVVGRNVYPRAADPGHLYVGPPDAALEAWERRMIGDWPPATSHVSVSAVAVSNGPDPVAVVECSAHPHYRPGPSIDYERWLLRVPLAGGRPEPLLAERYVSIKVLAVSPDGRRAAAGGRWQTIDVYGRPGDRPTVSAWLDGSETRALTFAPDGSRLAAANGRSGYLLDPGTGAITARIGEHAKQLNAVAFTPDGRRVMTAGNDGIVRAWDVPTGGLVTEWDFAVGPITAVAVACDGVTAAAGGSNGRLVVWNLDG